MRGWEMGGGGEGKGEACRDEPATMPMVGFGPFAFSWTWAQHGTDAAWRG